MPKNPILDQLRAAREKLLEDAGGTLDALVDRLQTEEKQSRRPRYGARRTTKSSEVAVDKESPPSRRDSIV